MSLTHTRQIQLPRFLPTHLFAAGLLAFFTLSIVPPIAINIEQSGNVVAAITRSDGTTIGSRPFRGAIVISPDDHSTLEAISRQDGLSATFILCYATLIDGKLEQTRCHRGLDHEELNMIDIMNMIDVNGSIVIPEGGDLIDNETSAADGLTQISCSALVTNGRIKSTRCIRMDYPKDDPFAPFFES